MDFEAFMFVWFLGIGRQGGQRGGRWGPNHYDAFASTCAAFPKNRSAPFRKGQRLGSRRASRDGRAAKDGDLCGLDSTHGEV
jgi:hypothetical protein